MKEIETLYAELTKEFRALEKKPYFKDIIAGYESSLWDFKVIAKDLFNVDLPKIEFSQLTIETP